ncbi:hypothetical protein OF389_09760 [Companilactobacillus farciminis]|nr:hypothetical protein [Companilactobacillus farciminis]
MKKCFLFFVLILFLGFIYIWNNFSITLADDNSAISSAPEGIDIAKYFYPVTKPIPAGSHNPFNVNFASIKNNHILDLADGPSNYGSLWGDADVKNYLDLRYPQTISAWLYFGPNDKGESYNGQGMALVLQNDPRKKAALGAGGESLGVDGYDRSTKTDIKLTAGLTTTTSFDSPQEIADTAVQNSLALEFDTQRNDATSTDSLGPTLFSQYNSGFLNAYTNWDYSLNSYETRDPRVSAPDGFPANTVLGASTGGFGHISFTFPSNPSSYYNTNKVNLSANANKFYPFSSSYSLFHTENTTAYLVDGTDSQGKPIVWHHLTFKWTPPENGSTIGTATYYFNDKDMDGTLNPLGSGNSFNKSISKSIKVDTKIFNLQTGQHTILWGFTGSNSVNLHVASKLVDFESIPALVSAHATSSIFDQNSNKTITDDSSDKTVSGGDNVSLNYQLKYDTGNVTWNDIKTHIVLPKHFEVTPDNQDNIGVINYSDGMIENIPASSLSTDKSYITYALRSSLNASNTNSANISINGMVNNTTGQDLSIEKEPAKFVGDTNISSTQTPDFTIKYRPTWSMSLNPLTDKKLLYEQKNASLDINPQLTYSDQHDFYDSDKIKYTFKIANHTFTEELPSNSNSDISSNTIDLHELINADSSNIDFWSLFPNQTDIPITVFATDKDNISTPARTFTVHVLQNKTLQITTSKNIEFSDTNVFSTNKILHRKENLILEITSLREPWSLSVTATPLKNGQNIFNGSLIFTDQDTSTHSLSDAPTFVTDDTASHNSVTTVNISKNWNDNSGILLKQTGRSEPGKYTGTLTWTASDIVKNT